MDVSSDSLGASSIQKAVNRHANQSPDQVRAVEIQPFRAENLPLWGAPDLRRPISIFLQ